MAPKKAPKPKVPDPSRRLMQHNHEYDPSHAENIFAQVTIIDPDYGDCNLVDLCERPLNDADWVRHPIDSDPSAWRRTLVDTGYKGGDRPAAIKEALTKVALPTPKAPPPSPSQLPPPSTEPEIPVLSQIQITHDDEDHIGNAPAVLDWYASTGRQAIKDSRKHLYAPNPNATVDKKCELLYTATPPLFPEAVATPTDVEFGTRPVADAQSGEQPRQGSIAVKFEIGGLVKWGEALTELDYDVHFGTPVLKSSPSTWPKTKIKDVHFEYPRNLVIPTTTNPDGGQYFMMWWESADITKELFELVEPYFKGRPKKQDKPEKSKAKSKLLKEDRFTIEVPVQIYDRTVQGSHSTGYGAPFSLFFSFTCLSIAALINHDGMDKKKVWFALDIAKPTENEGKMMSKIYKNLGLTFMSDADFCAHSSLGPKEKLLVRSLPAAVERRLGSFTAATEDPTGLIEQSINLVSPKIGPVSTWNKVINNVDGTQEIKSMVAQATIGPTLKLQRALMRHYITTQFSKARAAPGVDQLSDLDIADYDDIEGHIALVNRASIVTIFQREDLGLTMLFTGDAYDTHCDIRDSLAAWKDNYQAPEIMHVSVLKVPHHGSEVTASTEFYSRVRADVYLITGAHWRHGNPTLTALQAIIEGFVGKPRKGGEPYRIFFSDSGTLSDRGYPSAVKQLTQLETHRPDADCKFEMFYLKNKDSYAPLLFFRHPYLADDGNTTLYGLGERWFHDDWEQVKFPN